MNYDFCSLQYNGREEDFLFGSHSEGRGCEDILRDPRFPAAELCGWNFTEAWIIPLPVEFVQEGTHWLDIQTAAKTLRDKSLSCIMFSVSVFSFQYFIESKAYKILLFTYILMKSLLFMCILLKGFGLKQAYLRALTRVLLQLI